jgi:hypothetical protein
MAIYKEVSATVKSKYGFVPQTCWIAHVLDDAGKIKRAAPNRKDPNRRTKPCPPNKRTQIETVLKQMGMI